MRDLNTLLIVRVLVVRVLPDQSVLVQAKLMMQVVEIDHEESGLVAHC
jgi:hypothetical protein